MLTDISAALSVVNSATLRHNISAPLPNGDMKSIYDIRRTNLLLLKDQYGSWVKLNRAIGRDDRDSTFSQIANAAPDSRSKRPRTMGDRQAREIEVALGLQLHAMDREDGIRQGGSTPSPTARLVGQVYRAPGAGTTEPPDLTALLDDLRERIQAAPEPVRRAVMDLALQYLGSPEAEARIAKAIEALLEHGNPPAG